MIYFDNAATSGKKPQNVINAVDFALKNLSANPGRSGHKASLKTADAVYEVRKKLSDFFGCENAENVIFTLNCTHSINCVLKGVLQKGDHVVISNLEHNAVMRPLKKMKVSYTVAEVSENEVETIENFENSIRPNTKLVLTTAASNVSGQVLPYEKIGYICKKRNLYYCVDAAQGAGILPFDMKKMNIDYLCVAPHKGLYAPMGIGVLICRKPLNNTVLEGGTGTESLDFSQPVMMPEGFESGTISVPLILGVGAGVDFVKKVGIEKIYRHEFSLLEKIYDGLYKNKNIVFYTNKPEFGKNAPVLPINYRDFESYRFAEVLNYNNVAVRAGFHCAPTVHRALDTGLHGAVRVSFGAFNTKTEVEEFLTLVNHKNFIEKMQKRY